MSDHGREGGRRRSRKGLTGGRVEAEGARSQEQHKGRKADPDGGRKAAEAKSRRERASSNAGKSRQVERRDDGEVESGGT